MPHAYLGHENRLYLQYADAATGRTLEVAPGGSYDVRAREPGMPVPPADGRWAPASPPPLTDLAAEDETAAPEPETPEPAPPETSALPALPGTGDGGQPATDIKE